MFGVYQLGAARLNHATRCATKKSPGTNQARCPRERWAAPSHFLGKLFPLNRTPESILGGKTRPVETLNDGRPPPEELRLAQTKQGLDQGEGELFELSSRCSQSLG